MAGRASAAGRNELVSVTSVEQQGTSRSKNPSISGDGRFVAFETRSALVEADADNDDDIYLRDRSAGTTRLISRARNGEVSDDDSFEPHISNSGRFVVFSSDARNLAPNSPTEYGEHVYIHDVASGRTRLVNEAFDGGFANHGANRALDVSDNGRFVVFSSSASNLVENDSNGEKDVFIRDRTADRTIRLVGGSFTESRADINPNGAYVVYSTSLSHSSRDTNNVDDVYRYDVATGRRTLVSVTAKGWARPTASYDPQVSSNGRYVAFVSSGDVHARDMSCTCARQVANGNSTTENPAISGDGRYVVFTSTASDLLTSPDTNNVIDVFRRLVFNSLGPPSPYIERVSVRNSGGQANNRSFHPSVSQNGQTVAFASRATNLVDGDDNGQDDIVVRVTY